MNEHDFRRAWEQVTLSPEADARIQKALESACSDPERKVSYMNTEKRRFGRKIPKTAIAIIAAALLLTVTALAVVSSRIKMDLDAQLSVIMDIGHYTVKISATDDTPVELGYWYPEALPSDFEVTYVSEHHDMQQLIEFENELGDWLRLSYYTPEIDILGGCDGQYDMQEATINGSDAYLFTRTHPEELGLTQYSLVYWISPEQGVAFSLEYKGRSDREFDALAQAKSVAPQSEGLTPSTEEMTALGLEEFGDYQPAELPAGYILSGVRAQPSSRGGYVSYTFENADHATLCLFYYARPAISNTRLEYLKHDPSTLTVTVNGGDAYLEENPGQGPMQLNWELVDANLTFSLSADELTADELIAIANSVTLQ